MLKQLIKSAVRSFGYSIVNTKTVDRLRAASGEMIHSASALLPSEESLSAEHHYQAGKAARDRGDDEEAFKSFARANSLISRYGAAQNALREMSDECIGRATGAEGLEKTNLLVKALEMNPLNTEVRKQI